MESAKLLASRASVALSKGFAECLATAMSSSMGGGRYAWFLSASWIDVRMRGESVLSCAVGPNPEPEAEVDEREIVDAEGESLSEEDRPDMEKNEEDWVVVGEAGGEGSSMPSRSPSMISSSSSVDGKKLRKRSSACHLEAFLNSIQTSIRPGRESAGSSRSR